MMKSTAGVGTLLLELGTLELYGLLGTLVHYCWGWYTIAGDGSTTAGVGTLLLETGPLLLGLVHYCWSWVHYCWGWYTIWSAGVGTLLLEL